MTLRIISRVTTLAGHQYIVAGPLGLVSITRRGDGVLHHDWSHGGPARADEWWRYEDAACGLVAEEVDRAAG